jgi:hypothetical protein
MYLVNADWVFLFNGIGFWIMKGGEMPIKINGELFYRTQEACLKAGIAKNTFLRWVANGSYSDVAHRDRRGWRLFTQDDLERLTGEVNRIQIEEQDNSPHMSGSHTSIKQNHHSVGVVNGDI